MQRLRNFLRQWLGVTDSLPPAESPLAEQRAFDAALTARNARVLASFAESHSNAAMTEATRAQVKVDALCEALGVELAVTDGDVHYRDLKPSHDRHMDAHLTVLKLVDMQAKVLKQLLQRQAK